MERYGNTPIGVFDPKNAEEDIAASLFKVARQVFLKDGYHELIFFFFKKRKLLNMLVIRPENRAQKYLLMRRVAQEITKQEADAVVHLGEVWTAPSELVKPYQHAVDLPVREEALAATLVTKHGDPIKLVATIHRGPDGLTLGETDVLRVPALFWFAPVYKLGAGQSPKNG